MKVTRQQLIQVANQNRTTNQIGDNIKDGIGWETARDIGYISPDEAALLPISTEAARSVAPVIGETALTIAQMNANERAHIARAKEVRFNSGF